MKIFCKKCKKPFEAKRDNTVIEHEHVCGRIIFTVKSVCPECGEEYLYTYTVRIPVRKSGDY
ncbi:MAG: hypothetical protein PHZ04_02005 [Patescibacteria group bacterium]|nr:hypothetical protein [Patescibacteria group bacterium]